MDSTKVTDFVAKAKDFLLKNKVVAGIGLGVAVVAIGGYSFYQAQPKSILSAVEVEFDGYDGYGELNYNIEDIQKEIATIALKKSGFNQEEIEAIVEGDPIFLEEVWSDDDLEKKLKKANTIIDNVDYEFSKTSELKNGDKVTLTITNGSKKSPIKAEKKEYKVSGLEEVKTISTSEFLKENPVTFTGFNGYGKVVLPEDENGSYILATETTEGTSNYKNGDKVELVVSSSYLETLKSEGKKLESDVVEVEVSGLKEITDISNIADALAKNEVYVKSNYENDEYTTYTIEAQKSYIAYLTDYSSSGQVYLKTIYKITQVSKSIFSDTTETKVSYVDYGYRYYVKSDNSLDLETANKDSGYATQDLENLIADLKTEGYKEYTAPTKK